MFQKIIIKIRIFKVQGSGDAFVLTFPILFQTFFPTTPSGWQRALGLKERGDYVRLNTVLL